MPQPVSETDDRIVLAAEYALGTLDGEELAEARRLADADAAFAALVHGWERQFGELSALVGPIEPPPELQDKVKERIGNTPQPGVIHLPRLRDALPRLGPAPQLEMPRAAPPPAAPAPSPEVIVPPLPDQRLQIMALTQGLRRSRLLSGLLAALALVAGVVALMAIAQPDLLPRRLRPPPQIVERTVEKIVEKPAPRPVLFVAALQKDAQAPAFLLAVDLESRTMTVRRVAADAPGDRSYQLWLISSRYPGPQSLGVVGATEFTSVSIAAYDPETLGDAVYAVSLEPSGGSPGGSSTGPVLWSGKLIGTAPADRP